MPPEIRALLKKLGAINDETGQPDPRGSPA